MQHFI